MSSRLLYNRTNSDIASAYMSDHNGIPDQNRYSANALTIRGCSIDLTERFKNKRTVKGVDGLPDTVAIWIDNYFKGLHGKEMASHAKKAESDVVYGSQDGKVRIRGAQ